MHAVSTAAPRRGGRAAAFAPLASHVTPGVTRLRLGRLRHYIVCRIQPSFRGLPLLEHATAILDAHVLVKTFADWAQWTQAVRAIRSHRVSDVLQTAFDGWHSRIALMKRIKLLAAAHCRRTAKGLFYRWLRYRAARKRNTATSLIVAASVSKRCVQGFSLLCSCLQY